MDKVLYDKIINLIPSKTLKNKIESSNFKVSDMDLVYIIDHYEENILKKIQYLTQLLNNSINDAAIAKGKTILSDIEKAKEEINDDTIVSSNKYDEYRNDIWEESALLEYEGMSIGFVMNEYKPNWPNFLNKFDLVKIKPYYDLENEHYGIITCFQQEYIGPKATIFLFEKVKSSDLNATKEFQGKPYYVIPYNFSHDHILFECIEKADLDSVSKQIKDLYYEILDTISNRVNVTKYFYSKEIALKLENHKFNDIEKANIIDSSICSFDDKIKDFEELRDNTINYTLFNQLTHYVKKMKDITNNLSKNNNSEFYEVIDFYQEKYYFKKYEDAYQKGVELSQEKEIFQIKKLRMGNEHYKSEIYLFNNKGKIIWTNYDLFKDYKEIEENEELFINSYIDIPNIFNNDNYRIVKRYFPVPEFENESFDILVIDQQRRFDFRNNFIKRGGKLDITDVGPYVYIITNTEDIYSEPYPNIVNMYYVNEDDLTLSMKQDVEFFKKRNNLN